MSAKAIKVAARYGRKSDVVGIYQSILDEQYHVNAFTFPKYPIITSSDEVQVFNWGLIPFWVRTEEDATEIRKMTLNARADTIFEKPSFREPIMKKRCIVPSTGYFEWRHEGANKIPYYIYLKDEPIFSMAGIYDRWLDKDTKLSPLSPLIPIRSPVISITPSTGCLPSSPKRMKRNGLMLH